MSEIEQLVKTLGTLNTTIQSHSVLLQQLDDSSKANTARIATIIDSVNHIGSRIPDEKVDDGFLAPNSGDNQGIPGPTVVQISGKDRPGKYVWLGRDGPTRLLEKFDTFAMNRDGGACNGAELKRSYGQIKDGLNKIKLPEELLIVAFISNLS